jgi:hypothetical protein
VTKGASGKSNCLTIHSSFIFLCSIQARQRAFHPRKLSPILLSSLSQPFLTS